jgi:hypothetical protein
MRASPAAPNGERLGTRKTRLLVKVSSVPRRQIRTAASKPES